MQAEKPTNFIYMQKGTSNHSNQLKIVTLNYCGIMNNPFEFYCASFYKELSEISQIFDDLVHQQFKLQKDSKFKWEMGKVEQKVRLGRYSPSFDLNVGIEGNRFLSRKEFEERWDKSFFVMLTQNGLKFDEVHIKTAKHYDFIYFYTLLRYVYKKKSFEQLIKQHPKKYLETLGKFYEQSYLNDNKKLQKVEEHLMKLDADIIFLQEYSPLFEAYISKKADYLFVTDKSKDTIIVVKKSSFHVFEEPSQVLTQAEISSLNWAEKTSILIADKIILLSAHLSSNKEKNPAQIASLKEGLISLAKNHPNYRIILGGDLNSFLQPEPVFQKWFHMFPNKASEITTLKMRTMAQGQYDKGNIKNEQSKDKIISSFPIKENTCSITYINKIKPDANSFVPTDSHPFDHFLVTCVVSRV